MSAPQHHGWEEFRRGSATGLVGRPPAEAAMFDGIPAHQSQFSSLSSGVNRPTSSLAGAMDEHAAMPGSGIQPASWQTFPSQMNGPPSSYGPGFGPNMTATTGSHSPDSLPSASPSRASFNRLHPYNHPRSSRFQHDWAARTDARKRIYCSLNRAGNALCAWHDSRRERRIYGPRAAPQGLLNCGCSYEEALFEECLTRHGVGSYHPGEAVRMDPALRNPLLKLLEARYDYKDGDFDLDPNTGEWKAGQTPEDWLQKAQTPDRRSVRQRN